MKYIFLFLTVISIKGLAQLKDYQLTTKGDTINKIDKSNRKQGKWINRVEDNMGEPGFQEEGSYFDNEKVGKWRIYSLYGDPTGEEFYKYGQKSGKQQYFDIKGNLIREEKWRAITPDMAYDTIMVPDWKKDPTGNINKRVVVKLEGNALRDSTWKYFDENGRVVRTDKYIADKLSESMVIGYDYDRETGKLITSKQLTKYDLETGKVVASASNEKPKQPNKPQQVLDFEKTKKGKKKKFQDGSTGG
jgi:antitoxin component YwqK of YwqJK toxin-antitoxin module